MSNLSSAKCGKADVDQVADRDRAATELRAALSASSSRFPTRRARSQAEFIAVPEPGSTLTAPLNERRRFDQLGCPRPN